MSSSPRLREGTSNLRSALLGFRRLRTRVSGRWLRRNVLQFDAGDRRTPADFSRAAAGVAYLVRFYYLFVFFTIAVSFLEYGKAFRGHLPTDPLWPISLLNYLTGTEWLAHVTVISVAGSAVAVLAFTFPGALVWRLGVFLYLFLVGAVNNSYGSINHGVHLYLFISFALLFLPPTSAHRERMPRKAAMTYIMVFWFIQSIVLFCYSLAGYWKVMGNKLALLEPDSLVRILLARLMSDTIPVPPLLPLVASQPYLTQLLFLGIVYTQFFALFALFRPHLHRPFGMVLISFHLGSYYLTGVLFPHHIVFLAMFLLFSPLAPVRFHFFGLAQSLPLLGIPFRLWCKRRSRHAANSR